jgi:hypothetical protein
LEGAVVAAAWAGLAPLRRRLAAAVAVNLATHGLLWLAWPYLPGSYPARLAAAELAVVLLEAAAYRLVFTGSLRRALAASLVANALSTAAGLGLWRLLR